MDTQDLSAPASAEGVQSPAPAADPAPAASAVPTLAETLAPVLSDAVAAGVTAALTSKPADVLPAVLTTVEADTKPFWQSKTLIGIAGILASGIAARAGHTLAPADASALIDAGATLAASGFALLAAIGHVTSTKKPV